MSARHFIENVPDLRRLALDHFLRAPNRVDIAEIFQPSNDERLEQNKRHLLGQTALMQFQFRSDYDDRSARVIDAFAEQILAETSAFALEHVAKRFQWTIARAGNSAAVTTIVEQRIDCFLQHSLFISNDDVRRFKLEQI